jgi:hypothetical protein
LIQFSDAELDVMQTLSNVDIANVDRLNIYGDEEGAVLRPEDAKARTTLKVWVSLKKEMYLALCTDDPKYSKLRDMAGSIESQTSTVAATLVSAVAIGVPAALLVPIAKVLVVAILHLGTNVFCKVNESNKVLGRLTQREQQVLRELYQETSESK